MSQIRNERGMAGVVELLLVVVVVGIVGFTAYTVYGHKSSPKGAVTTKSQTAAPAPGTASAAAKEVEDDAVVEAANSAALDGETNEASGTDAAESKLEGSFNEKSL